MLRQCGAGYGGWRNGLLLDPTEEYQGMSYTEFMLNPLADALNAIITQDTVVNFAMQATPLLCCLETTPGLWPRQCQQAAPQLHCARLFADTELVRRLTLRAGSARALSDCWLTSCWLGCRGR